MWESWKNRACIHFLTSQVIIDDTEIWSTTLWVLHRQSNLMHVMTHASARAEDVTEVGGHSVWSWTHLCSNCYKNLALCGPVRTESPYSYLQMWSWWLDHKFILSVSCTLSCVLLMQLFRRDLSARCEQGQYSIPGTTLNGNETSNGRILHMVPWCITDNIQGNKTKSPRLWLGFQFHRIPFTLIINWDVTKLWIEDGTEASPRIPQNPKDPMPVSLCQVLQYTLRCSLSMSDLFFLAWNCKYNITQVANVVAGLCLSTSGLIIQLFIGSTWPQSVFTRFELAFKTGNLAYTPLRSSNKKWVNTPSWSLPLQILQREVKSDCVVIVLHVVLIEETA